MREATSEYYHATGIPTYYYSFSENITSDHEIQGDRLLLKGKESYLPGVLDKTLAAMRVFQDCDYLIRSNSSTVIDLPALKKDLQQNPIDYGGSFVHELHWLDPGNGIRDRVYWGTRYASGTCIILSRSALTKLLSSDIDKTIIDDVAIGVAMKKHGIRPKCFLSRFTTIDRVPYELKSKWFYRHRTHDRLKDTDNIKWLSKTLRHSLLSAG
jgi:hypothetical protein